MHDPKEISRRFGTSDPLEWNLRTLASVCNAVHFAHSRGILHRDLKPENVMIGEFGEVYVLDWGIAVSLKDDPSGRLPPASQAKEIAGTPHYMAPEMLLGDPALLSPRTDVYQLGAILYEIFAGKPPHDADSLHAMLTVILLSAPSFAPSFPPEARRICERAMSREPAARHETALELRRVLDDYLLHRGSRRLAHDAKQSFTRLQAAISGQAAGEDKKLAIANLLGECRFGYHAALSAWPGNEVARQGLDRALLLVVELELKEGDAAAAATLLRDVSSPPADVAARVEAAMRARAGEEERLRKIELDHDPRIGTRTRMFVLGSFGIAWSASTFLAWIYWTGRAVPYFAAALLPSLVSLGLGLLAFVWARESLSKTLLNRQLAQSFVIYTVAQTLLGAGGWVVGIPWQTQHLIYLFAWTLTYALLAVWAARWFAAPAVASLFSFLVACVYPSFVYPLMTVCSLVLTFVVVRYWLPTDDRARIQARQQAMRQRATRWLGPTD
jgi:serine/threonine-protein kinase